MPLRDGPPYLTSIHPSSTDAGTSGLVNVAQHILPSSIHIMLIDTSFLHRAADGMLTQVSVMRIVFSFVVILFLQRTFSRYRVYKVRLPSEPIPVQSVDTDTTIVR